MGSDDKIIKCVNVHDTARVCLYELCVITRNRRIYNLVKVEVRKLGYEK